MKKFIFRIIMLIVTLSLVTYVSVLASEYKVEVVCDGGEISDNDLNNIWTDDRFAYICKADGTLYVFDSDGRVVTDGVYQYTDHGFHDGLLMVCVVSYDNDIPTHWYGFIDENGDVKVDIAFTELNEFKDERAIGVLHGNTVMINTNGDTLHTYDGVYGYFGEFINGFAFVRKAPLVEGIQYMGAEKNIIMLTMIPERTLMYISIEEKELMEKYKADSQDSYDLIDEDGNTIVTGLTAEITFPNYDVLDTKIFRYPRRIEHVNIERTDFNEFGICIAKSGENYGMVNSSGEIVADFKFPAFEIYADKILYFLSEPDEEGNLTYCYDIYGNLLYKNPYKYSSIYSYTKSAEMGGLLATIKYGNLAGVVDGNNRVLIPIEYDGIYKMEGSKYLSDEEQQLSTEIDYFYIYNNRKVGLRSIHSDHDDIPPWYDIIKSETLIDGTTLAYAKNDNIYTYFELDGTVYITPEYEKIKIDKEDNFIIERHDGLYGATDLENNIILPFEYDEVKVSRIRDGEKIAIIQKDNKYGLMDFKNRIIIDTVFDGIGYFNDRNNDRLIEDDTLVVGSGYKLIKVNRDGKFAILNILDPDKERVWYDEIKLMDSMYKAQTEVLDDYNFHNFIVKIGDKYGLIDAHNNIILPIEYEDFFDRNNKYIIANKDGKIGVLDYDLNAITPYIFEKLDIFRNDNDGYVFGAVDGVMRQYDIKNQKLTDFVLKSVDCAGDDYYYVYVDTRRIKTNLDGTPYEKNIKLRHEEMYGMEGVIAFNNYESFEKRNMYGQCYYDTVSANMLGVEAYYSKDTTIYGEYYYDSDRKLIFYSKDGKTYDASGNVIFGEPMVIKTYGDRPFYDNNLYWAYIRGNTDRGAIVKITKID